MAPDAFLQNQKFKTSNSMNEFMASLFWDRKGILLVDFMSPGAKVNPLKAKLNPI